MNTAFVLALAALSLIIVAPAANAAATAADTGGSPSDGRIYCQPLPDPLNGPWMLVCGVVDKVCRTTDLCR